MNGIQPTFLMPKPYNISQKEDVIIKKLLRMRKSLHCTYSQIHLLTLHNDTEGDLR